MPKPPSPNALRAAKLSHVPGVTIAVASARFEVGPPDISRARKLAETRPSLAELALAALTDNGLAATGTIDLAGLATWLDYLNHDACTPAEARALLDESVARGLLAIEGDRYRLLGEWP